jgi:hypothetical protein
LKVDLHDVSSFSTNVGELICGINNAAGENTLDLVSENVSIFNLLLNEIKIPSTETIRVDCQTLGGRRVEEANFVCNVHTNRVTNEGFAAFNIPNDNGVIVLSTEGSKMLLIVGERQ